MPRTRTYGLDIDSIRYAQRVKSGSGTTILPEPLKQINKFVIGVKKLGLWNSMVCWPMRGIHNAGTGSTVYSLGDLGRYNGNIYNLNGSLINLPTWSTNGIKCSVYNNQISLGAASVLHSYGPFSYLSVQKYDAIGAGQKPVIMTRFDSQWPGATYTIIFPTTAAHRLNVSNTRRVLANASFPGRPDILTQFHSQLTTTAGNETGFVTYNKGTSFAFEAATADAVAPTSTWRLRGDADVTFTFQLIAHQNTHSIREPLYNLYRSTLGIGLYLP